MIDNLKEAIEHAKEVAENWKSQLVNCVSEEGRNKCLECVAEHEKIAEWLTELQERREADRWIPVREKLPEEDGKCLVLLDFGDVNIDYYDKDWGFVCYIGNVTHWKPMPKPYESEDK